MSVSKRGSVPEWLRGLVDSADLNLEVRVRASRHAICLLCRGGKLLCGKPACPVTMQYYSLLKVKGLLNKEEVSGSSPPAIFVGRFGYPRVYVGPLVPPLHGDTSVYDLPEAWLDKSFQEILDMRTTLVLGRKPVDCRALHKLPSKILEVLDIALASGPVEAEVRLAKKPRKVLSLSEDLVPFGPTGPMKEARVGTIKLDPLMVKMSNDRDLAASEAVVELYRRGVPVSRIQRAFSVGAFGVYRRRKLVPTRWSITAVDSIISLSLIDEVKEHPWIDKYEVYVHDNFENRYVIILAPGPWSYEWIEAWEPNTFWNPSSRRAVLFSDWEGARGRTTYARPGGCYYAARLAVAEHLARRRRQAVAVCLREIYPGYLFPLGVWNVRENVRAALAKRPEVFETLADALKYAFSKLRVSARGWLLESELLKQLILQRRLTDFT